MERSWGRAYRRPHPTTAAAQAEPIWTGAWTLPAAEQGLKALGTPIGHPDYVAAALTAKRASHDRLLDAIPSVSDTQVAFLLLLQCACPRANYLLRVLPPSQTDAFAQAHDTAIAACLARILTEGTPLPLPAQQRARLALAAGGLGLRSAHASRQAAYWASWADSLPAIHRRLPAAADRILHLLRGEVRPLPPAVIEATQATHALRAHGFQPPAWDTLTLRGPPQPLPRDAGDYTTVGGNASPAQPKTATSWPRSFLTWTLPRARSCIPRLVPMRVAPSPCTLRIPSTPCR